jgi:hypothetical protein
MAPFLAPPHFLKENFFRGDIRGFLMFFERHLRSAEEPGEESSAETNHGVYSVFAVTDVLADV